MHQDHVGISGGISQSAHAAEHLLTPAVRVAAVGNEEREEPDVRRLESLGDLDGVSHALQVRWELIVDGDLADWRADAGNVQAMLGKGLPHRVQLAGIEIENVGSPRAADLYVPQT
jgi:hypothetical protein